jgi:glutamine synthetase
VPSSLHEAVAAFQKSAVARAAFGDAVFGHLATMARKEQEIFDNNVVTDWEVSRYFEQG